MLHGPGFNYYSQVAKLTSVRLFLLRGDRPSRFISTGDIPTAFLQSDDYTDDEPIRFVKFREPYNNYEWQLYQQIGPFYGQRSTPVLWEGKRSRQLCNHGFTRCHNEPSLYVNPTTKVLVLIYVDDFIVDALTEKDRDDFMALMKKLFRVNPLSIKHLTEDNAIDFLGLNITMSKKNSLSLTCESTHKDL